VRRAARIVLPLAAIAAAVALALVSQAVFAAAGDLRSPDVSREPSRSLPSRVATRLVSSSNTLTYRRALRLLRQKNGPKTDVVRRRGEAEIKLERLTAHGPRPMRSRAENLLAILRLQDTLQERGDAAAAVTSAIRSFTDAVRLDPGNADAKYNLELLLTLRPKPKTHAKTTKPIPKPKVAATGHAGTVHSGSGY
jgi:hypothetical protein